MLTLISAWKSLMLEDYSDYSQKKLYASILYLGQFFNGCQKNPSLMEIRSFVIELYPGSWNWMKWIIAKKLIVCTYIRLQTLFHQNRDKNQSDLSEKGIKTRHIAWTHHHTFINYPAISNSSTICHRLLFAPGQSATHPPREKLNIAEQDLYSNLCSKDLVH